MTRYHAHPRRHDDLRLVAQCAAFVLLLFLVVAAASLATAPRSRLEPSTHGVLGDARGDARAEAEAPGQDGASPASEVFPPISDARTRAAH